MADKLINCRIPLDWHEQIRAISDHNGITISEFLRGAIDAALRGVPGDLSLTELEGYKQARSLASKLAHEMLDIAKTELPDTYEEAVARYGFTPHAAEHDDATTGWKRRWGR